MNNKIVYAVRNTETGKLVSDLGSRHKKYWNRKADAEAAIRNNWRYNILKLKIVAFELVEVKGDLQNL